QGESRPDIRSRINQKSPVGRPHWIDRILRDQGNWRRAIEEDACQARLAIADRCRQNRLPIRRPARLAPQCEPTGEDPGMRPINVDYAQERSAALLSREGGVSAR